MAMGSRLAHLHEERQPVRLVTAAWSVPLLRTEVSETLGRAVQDWR
jgi:hypothetical protein